MLLGDSLLMMFIKPLDIVSASKSREFSKSPWWENVSKKRKRVVKKTPNHDYWKLL